MKIISYSSSGYEGELINIEVNIFTRSLPGIDIVGLPGGAVKESKVRFRSAIINSGFDFPKGRIIINMSPAGEKKEGACYDLPFACRVLSYNKDILIKNNFLVLGELTLDGSVREVNSVLPAVSKAIDIGVFNYIIPYKNLNEALILKKGNVYGVHNLEEAMLALNGNKIPDIAKTKDFELNEFNLDFSDVVGQEAIKRSLEIAVTGGHNILLFGPPGVGKSLSVSRIKTIIPKLTLEESLETTRIWSIAGKLNSDYSLVQYPPIRKPHHGASLESIVGGGKEYKPGEISLAHNGYLLLDEISEFKTSILQSLREPIEESRVNLNRASVSTWFPSSFRLIATANPCPCANLGKEDGICMCSEKEIRRYWKKMGGAIMDRIDIRVPVKSDSTVYILGKKGRNSEDIKRNVLKGVNIQRKRFKNKSYKCNAKISPGDIDLYCKLSNNVKNSFIKGVKKLSLSSRGCHSVLKISRTIADLDNSIDIKEYHVLEAFELRRYGDEDYYFN